MDAEVKTKWLALPATRNALHTAQNNRPFVMPAPQADFNPAYGNWAFGWITGFEAALKLMENGGDLYEAPQQDMPEETWGTSSNEENPE